MTERAKLQDRGHLRGVQYATPANWNARKDLYDAAVPAHNIYRKALDRLGLSGAERVLDVGCGKGHVLLALAEERYHRGPLVGLDLVPALFSEVRAHQNDRPFQMPVDFCAGSADKLPFPLNSFDVLCAFFMAYHLPNIPKSLAEWARVLAPKGRLVVATGSAGNKPKHQYFKRLIGKAIGKMPHSQFSASFNLENAHDQLLPFFKIQRVAAYSSEIHITTPEPYLAALSSVRDMFTPVPSDDEWRHALEPVRLKIAKDIERQGYFSDSVRRGFFICEKR